METEKIFIEKIIDEINRELVKKYPFHTVHIDLCPVSFERPAFLIEYITSTQSSVNYSTIKWTDYFTITCFDTTDDYSNSSTLGLLTVQQGVLDIFRKGYIKVDNRALEVASSTGGRNFDKAYIDLQFEYYDDRFKEEKDKLPLMKDVYVKMKEE